MTEESPLVGTFGLPGQQKTPGKSLVAASNDYNSWDPSSIFGGDDGGVKVSDEASIRAREKAEEMLRVAQSDAESEIQALRLQMEQDEEEAKRVQSELDSQQLSEENAPGLAREQTRPQAEKDEQSRLEEEERLKREAQARAEEAAAEEKKLAVEKARLQAEVEERAKLEEEERVRCEAQARAEEEAAAEERRKLAAEKARLQAEAEERVRLEEEEERVRARAEEEAAAEERKLAVEKARLQAEVEERAKLEEEERLRCEAQARAEEEVAAEERRKLAAEKARLQAEAEERVRLEEEERVRARAEEEAAAEKRKLAAEKARLQAEVEERAKLEEEERLRCEAQARAEEEAAAEERRKLAAEKARLQAEAEERVRLEEEEERLKREAQARAEEKAAAEERKILEQAEREHAEARERDEAANTRLQAELEESARKEEEERVRREALVRAEEEAAAEEKRKLASDKAHIQAEAEERVRLEEEEERVKREAQVRAEEKAAAEERKILERSEARERDEAANTRRQADLEESARLEKDRMGQDLQGVESDDERKVYNSGMLVPNLNIQYTDNGKSRDHQVALAEQNNGALGIQRLFRGQVGRRRAAAVQLQLERARLKKKNAVLSDANADKRDSSEDDTEVSVFKAARRKGPTKTIMTINTATYSDSDNESDDRNSSALSLKKAQITPTKIIENYDNGVHARKNSDDILDELDEEEDCENVKCIDDNGGGGVLSELESIDKMFSCAESYCEDASFQNYRNIVDNYLEDHPPSEENMDNIIEDSLEEAAIDSYRGEDEEFDSPGAKWTPRIFESHNDVGEGQMRVYSNAHILQELADDDNGSAIEGGDVKNSSSISLKSQSNHERMKPSVYDLRNLEKNSPIIRSSIEDPDSVASPTQGDGLELSRKLFQEESEDVDDEADDSFEELGSLLRNEIEKDESKQMKREDPGTTANDIESPHSLNVPAIKLRTPRHYPQSQTSDDQSAYSHPATGRSKGSRQRQRMLQARRQNAATLIQSVFRSYKARHQAKLRRERMKCRVACPNCGMLEQVGAYCKRCGRRMGRTSLPRLPQPTPHKPIDDKSQTSENRKLKKKEKIYHDNSDHSESYLQNFSTDTDQRTNYKRIAKPPSTFLAPLLGSLCQRIETITIRHI